jgi:anhydro-N-acetylmuramic acid kinase
MSRLFVGIISGTSMDAIDLVVADCSDEHPCLIASLSVPFDIDLKMDLQALVEAGPQANLSGVMRAHRQLGSACAGAVRQLLKQNKLKPRDIVACGLHGQTVLHVPDGEPGFSVQLGDGNTLAMETGIVTVADFRGMDIAAGGQGAPLAPLLHRDLFADPQENRAVVNLGGIANITVLPRKGKVIGYDTGPANCLMDAWALEQINTHFDDDGRWAAVGQVDDPLLAAMETDPYFSLAAPKSTGTDYFNMEWLRQQIGEHSYIDKDIQTTLAELTAWSVAREVRSNKCDRVLLCGGGVHNSFLTERITALVDGIPVQSTSEYGVDADWVEGLLFAWLASQRLDERAFDLKPITGSKSPVVLGSVYQPALDKAR